MTKTAVNFADGAILRVGVEDELPNAICPGGEKIWREKGEWYCDFNEGLKTLVNGYEEEWNRWYFCADGH